MGTLPPLFENIFKKMEEISSSNKIDDISKRRVKDVYQAHSILYAVRIPGVDNLESVIPVNTYRIIFNN